ncbi:hypothetical protein [Roseibacillus persicicus]|uniref:hypothetical protein n=1 Tax=Roseibacillus persicicus TaxID=454148 RepID=UPI00280C6DE4|nr:hypothetical protein [Roseibacillus persicicus]MDQ8189323.1 hypothetical protein [Roseibacillus persicicus]
MSVFRILPLLILPVWAAPVELLVVPGGVGISTYATDSGYAEIEQAFGGNLRADITIDPLSGEPTSFFYQDGCHLTYSGGSSNYVPNDPAALDSFELIFDGLSSDLSTNEAGGGVEPGTGQLEQEHHSIRLKSGTLTVNYFYAGTLILEHTVDYAEEPLSGETRGTTSVKAILLEAGVVSDRYEVTLEHDSTAETFITDPFEMTISDLGGFEAVGEVMVPSAGLVQWVTDSGAPVPRDASDKLGAVPVGILYALGLSVGVREVPWILEPHLGKVALSLQSTGTRSDLFVESSSDLQHWNQTLVAAGSAGSFAIELPEGDSFVRLALPEES